MGRGKVLRYLDIDVAPTNNTPVDNRESFFGTLIATRPSTLLSGESSRRHHVC